MKTKNIGKLLITVGIFVAVLPMIILPSITYSNPSLFGSASTLNIVIYLSIIVGIIIIVVGERKRKQG